MPSRTETDSVFLVYTPFLAVVRAAALMATIAVAGCTWSTPSEPSVLVIMVENLGFGSINCGDDADFEVGSGFQVFCEQSVRFTHAYTPSLLTQPTIASILTAKFPYENGVRHNGAQFLSAHEVTVAEAALPRGFRTSFFSGGPPVLRRSGINQGFEIFDDHLKVNYKHLYRSAQEIVSLFLNWQDRDAQKKKFFSVLYLADAAFIDAPTTNELGELRESSFKGQIDVIDGAVGRLVREMKKRKIWENTNVFLVGLNGNPADSREGEIPAMDLYSDGARTTLMVKPARKKRDGEFNWKIDANISLTDIGVTLYEMVGAPLTRTQLLKPAAPVSLRSVLNGPEPDWPQDREILTESAWTSWQGIGGIRAALRKGPFLYLYDERDRLYNTLTDNFESMPLPRLDDLPASTRASMSRFLNKIGFYPWSPVPKLEVDREALGKELWRSRIPDSETIGEFRHLLAKYPDDGELTGWRALLAMRQGDWKDLKVAAGPPNPPVRPDGTPRVHHALWAFVANVNLGDKTAVVPDDPCLTFLKPGGERRVGKECLQSGVHDLADWANESLPVAERDRAMESFIRFYLDDALEIRVAEYNQVAGRVWDTPRRIEEPAEYELIMALPEMRRIRTIARARLDADRK